MPVHDYECVLCGAAVRDHYQPRTDTSPPPCPNAGTVTVRFRGAELHLELYIPGMLRDVMRIPQHRMERVWSLSSGGRVKFSEFDMDGVHYSSLGQVRKMEKASEGTRQPQIIRQYSQDRSNREKNVFGEPPVPKFSTRTKRGIPFRKLIEMRD